MWLGRSAKNKDKPLGFKWVSCPTRFLGVHLSYDKKGNDYQNFDLKIGKLQSWSDMESRDDATRVRLRVRALHFKFFINFRYFDK